MGLPTKAITSGILKFWGTLVSQKIRGVTQWDWKQVKQFVLFAVFLDMPVSEPWYSYGLNILSNAVGLTALHHRRPQLGRFLEAVLDQFTFGIFHNAYFFVMLGITGGQSLRESWGVMLSQIVPTTKESFVFWIPATFASLNMRPALQIPALNFFGTLWATWLAYQEKKREEAGIKGPPRLH